MGDWFDSAPWWGSPADRHARRKADYLNARAARPRSSVEERGIPKPGVAGSSPAEDTQDRVAMRSFWVGAAPAKRVLGVRVPSSPRFAAVESAPSRITAPCLHGAVIYGIIEP